MRKTIVIADDHPLTAEGMEAALGDIVELDVVGSAQNGIDAIALIKRTKPDCALLDLSMPGANGIEVFLEAKRWSPETKFAIITGISAASLFEQLAASGVDGLFVKNCPPEEISDGVRNILNGKRVISSEAQEIIGRSAAKQKLSKREYEVLQGLARGLNNKQIADRLGVSPKTIDGHRTNLLRKMDANNTASLLMAAMRGGLLEA